MYRQIGDFDKKLSIFYMFCGDLINFTICAKIKFSLLQNLLHDLGESYVQDSENA